MPCPWCNTDPIEAAEHHEGPHATWCPHFREEQRGGACTLCRAAPATEHGKGQRDGFTFEWHLCRGCFDANTIPEVGQQEQP